MRRKTPIFVCLALFAAFAVPAQADTFDAFSGNIKPGSPQSGGINTTGEGRQTWGSPALTLGLDFEVLAESILVSELAIWDDVIRTNAGLVQTLSSPHRLAIWNYDTGALLGEIFTRPGQGVLRNDFRYFKLDGAIELDKGAKFTVSVYYGRGNQDSNGNSGKSTQDLEPTPTFNDGDGSIIGIDGDTIGGRFLVGDGFPTLADKGPFNRYHAISFSYTPNPEPGTILLIAGVGALAGVVRRRRRRKAVA